MGKKQKNSYEQVYDPPENLDNCPFFGYTLNPEQKIFRDAIWSKDKDIVFCNAPAGSGKTFVAVATAYLLVQYKRYNGIVYIASPVQEGRQYSYGIGVYDFFNNYSREGWFIKGEPITSNLIPSQHNIAVKELSGGIYLYNETEAENEQI